MTSLLIILLAFAILCAYKMARTDWRKQIIPDVYLWPFMLAGLIIVAYFPWACDIGESVIAAALGYALALLVGYIFTKSKNQESAIGLGDIKLIAAGGIWLGPTGLAIALGLSCIAGYIWGKYTHRKHIPFAPFFFGGMIVALVKSFVFF